MKNIIALVLAAGRGTRMKSEIPKVLHSILGKPIISHILDSVKAADVADITVVVGHGGGEIKKALKTEKVLVQKELLGSGDAVNTAKKAMGKYQGDVLVVCGDTPLIRPQTLNTLIAKHKSSGASATVLTVALKDPTGYGRIVKNGQDRVIKIIEEENTGLYEKVIEEVNVGAYCFKGNDLFEALSELKVDAKKKEYFLTDVIEILNKKSRRVEAFKTAYAGEAIGVNTRKDLANATQILKNRILEDLMLDGVTIEDPLSTTIYPDVKIGRGTIISPNTIIESDVEIGRDARIGPFARIRSGTRIGDNAEVGNFVELVRTEVGENTKIKHHTYLGDAVVGKNVNIGAGAITANFDGVKKSRTVIEAGAFIGIGARLIAPVRIGKGAMVGAGCVVPKNHDVPEGAMVMGVPARRFEKRRKGERRDAK